MSDRRAPSSPQGGFSLVELVVTLIVLSVLLMMAAPSFVTFRKNSELTSAVGDLSSTLSNARTEAMRRGVATQVQPGAPASAASIGWTDGWYAYADNNRNGSYAAASDDLISQHAALPSSVSLDGSNAFAAAGKNDYVRFNGDGFARKSDGSFISNTYVQLTNGIRRRRIIMQPTGQVVVCDPDAAAGSTDSCP